MKTNDVENVLMVANYPSDTGYAWWLMEHFWKTLADWITSNGGTAYLAYPKITSLTETIRTAPIKVVELNIPWQTRRQELDVKKFLQDKSITSIYFTDQPFFSLKYLKLRIYGIRQIVIHDHTPGDRPYVGGLKGALKALRNKLPWFSVDYILCVSEWMRQRNMLNSRIGNEKCIVVQNGIVPVECKEEVKTKIRKELNIKPTTTMVVTTGRAHPYKRFDFIIRCAKILKEQTPDLDVVFVLVGDGPAMQDLKTVVRGLCLKESVRLLGFRSDIRDILCESDIALHAALGEGFSLSIVEYMSAGLPVMVPDIPSVSQAITHNDTGVIYSKDDAESVATNIHSLVMDNKRRVAMGSAARDTANSIYTLDKCTKDFILALNQIWSK